MNERLKQLAAQAGFLGEDLDKTVFGTCHSTALEYFAELIVEQCAQQISRTNLEDTDGGDWEVLRAAATQLREKFNIK